MSKNQHTKYYEDQIIAEIERLLPTFRSFAIGLCGNTFVADDLVQSACERALERLDQVKDVEGVRRWVNRILYTRWQDLIRKRRSRKAKLLSFGQYRAMTQQSAGNPGDLHSTAKLDIEKGLERLSDEHRAVLALVSIAGHDYQEASVILDVPIGTVASRVARAKAMLAQHLRPVASHNNNLKYGSVSDE